MRADVAVVTEQLPQVLGRYIDMRPGALACWTQEAAIAGGEAAREGWRALFAQAILQWNDKGATT